jgi:hypothetical protein
MTPLQYSGHITVRLAVTAVTVRHASAALPAEVEVDRILELLRESERLRTVL